MIFSRIGNKNGGSRYDDQRAPTKGSVVAAAAFFRFCSSDGVFFYWTITVMKTVNGNKNSVWKGNCPPLFPKGESKTEFPETHPPEGAVSTKGQPQLPEQKPGVLSAFSSLLELPRIVHGNRCFIEQTPAHTPSGLPADNQGFHTVV